MKPDNPLPKRRGARDRKGCIIEGCERKHHGRGYCIPHYMQWRKRGSATPPPGKEWWTPEEDRQLFDLPTAGRSGRAAPGAVEDVALMLGRSVHATHVRRSRLLRERRERTKQ